MSNCVHAVTLKPRRSDNTNTRAAQEHQRGREKLPSRMNGVCFIIVVVDRKEWKQRHAREKQSPISYTTAVNRVQSPTIVSDTSGEKANDCTPTRQAADRADLCVGRPDLRGHGHEQHHHGCLIFFLAGSVSRLWAPLPTSDGSDGQRRQTNVPPASVWPRSEEGAR